MMVIVVFTFIGMVLMMRLFCKKAPAPSAAPIETTVNPHPHRLDELYIVYNVRSCKDSCDIPLCLGETISIDYDMERQNFEVDGGSSVALCQ